ncbi:MAG: hypothetical protein JWN25_741 [Verrucomicrobiales bacterium]|nr:hypothetical protein [Verrucomicrobiales bacterium]
MVGVFLTAVAYFAGVGGFLIAWMGICFCITGIAHAIGRHAIYGKQGNGKLTPWGWLLFFPFLSFTHFTWHVMRWISREPKISKVNDELFIGRRLLANEVDLRVANYLDLTAEFAEPIGVRKREGYRSFPILDGACPTPEALGGLVAGLPDGATFIHCAQGHGRTGLVPIALLLHRKQAKTVQKALQLLQDVRPGLALNRRQMKCVVQFDNLRKSKC